ncbi:MAG: carboxymuconolactone decarboxylase family protein [Oscillospiraceae bacterium]|nr:carboxymuconolactone decarboxylase family protein [Oscillospiraceae bacterium]
MVDSSRRKLFSLKEIYRALVDGMRTAPLLSKARRRGEIDHLFMERIMLAVTEVNGCAICSYAHSKMALNAGMSDSEIRKMMAGSFEDTPEEQLAAILFAQHYAESRNKPDRAVWERLQERYGRPEAEGILGAVRIITMGNAMGIPWGSLCGRFRGKADSRSSILYEIGSLFGLIVIFPISIIHSLVLTVLRRPLIL